MERNNLINKLQKELGSITRSSISMSELIKLVPSIQQESFESKVIWLKNLQDGDSIINIIMSVPGDDDSNNEDIYSKVASVISNFKNLRDKNTHLMIFDIK